MKKYLYTLLVIGIVGFSGCAIIPDAFEAGYDAYREDRANKKAEKEARLKKEEEERIAREKAEAERIAKEKAEREAREEALKPPPHPPERRVETQKAGDDYYARGEKPDILIVQNPLWKRTLWKPQNHSMNGIVMLLDAEFMADYKAGNIASVVISADPYGNQVINGTDGSRTVSGVGKVVKPYHERPAVRWDGLVGKHWRPGPVFIVLKMKDGRRTTWMLADPALRTER